MVWTALFEIKSKNYPRRLKIEIRQEIKKIETESENFQMLRLAIKEKSLGV